MRLYSRITLSTYWVKEPESERALRAWVTVVKGATWKTPAEVKDAVRSASFVGDNRVVFNIAGNKYRLVVRFYYEALHVYVRFIGTHAEYDAINPETI